MKTILKNILYAVIATGMTAGVTSCMDLEREDFTEISPDNFFKTETDLRLAVDALYYTFNSGDWNGVYRADYSGYQVMSDMTTDNMWSNWGWDSDAYYFHQWTGTTGQVQDEFWNAFSLYNFMSKARNVILKIENCGVSDNIKEKYIGEAHALRGWMGLVMYDLFGPIPVAGDEILENPENFVYLPRLTDEEYDEMMENDLLTAIEQLPDMPEERGRMAKGPARMILMKYYMIRGFYTKAEAIARDLYAMEGRYSLQQDYEYIFSKAGIGNNEIILQIPCNLGKSGTVNVMTAECLPTDMPWTDKSTGWGGYVMPWDFYDSFDANDKRLVGVVDQYINTSGKLVARSDMKYGAVFVKYGKDPDMVDSRSSIDLVIYRYSDVLLSLAELINRNTGAPTAEAIELVNRVRHRAGLDDLDATATAGYDAFNEAILMERGHEFYLEGLRRQDLIRFGKYVEYANNRINKINSEEGRGYFNVDDSHNRMPIPASFIDESKSAIVQNPGY